jgi:paraquat-inducible protein B
VLIATGFALFGGSKIFTPKNRYIAVFDEPTNGLRVGANVVLNGVRVGYVSDIDLIIDRANYETDTRVVLELLPEDIKSRSGERLESDFTAELDHDTLINEAGMRATLEIESFVTGQLLVELLLRPETPVVMRAVDPLYPEIPTITSNIQELLNDAKIWFADIRENLDVGGLSRRLNNVLQAIDDLARSEDLHQSLAGINQFVNDQDTQDIGQVLKATLDEISKASAAAAGLFSEASKGVDMLTADLTPVLKQLATALEEAEQTLSVAKEQLQGDSQQLYQLSATLEELERTARAVREFFDYMERNPESMLRGKSD